MSASPPPPFHLVYNPDGTRKIPLPTPEDTKKEFGWWVGLAHALWLDLGYLVWLLLLLITLSCIVIKTPYLRNMECLKPTAEVVEKTAEDIWGKAKAVWPRLWFVGLGGSGGGGASGAGGAGAGGGSGGGGVPFVPLVEVAVNDPAPTKDPPESKPAPAEPPAREPEPPAPPAPEPEPPKPEPPVVVPTPPAQPEEPTPAVVPPKEKKPMPTVPGTLTLHLKSGFDLMAMDEADLKKKKKASSDPYALVTLPGGKPEKSRVVNNTLHPVWDEKFSVSGKTLAEYLKLGPIKIELFDKDFVKSDFMGVLEFTGDQWDSLQLDETMKCVNVRLPNVKHGKLTFDLTFSAIDGKAYKA